MGRHDDDCVEKVEYRGHTIKIYPDEDAQSPREDSNCGHFVCWHRNYKSPDKHDFSEPEDFLRWWQPHYRVTRGEGDGQEWLWVYTWGEKKGQEEWSGYESDAAEYTEQDRPLSEGERWEEVPDTGEGRDAVVLPVYMYDHSGVSISTGRGYPFSDPWDSGQWGFIYTTKADAEEIGFDWDKAEEVLRQEVATYNDYLMGNVYGFVIEDPKGEDIDSCWGFWPETDKPGGLLKELEYMLAECRSEIDHAIENEEKQARQIKEMFAL